VLVGRVLSQWARVERLLGDYDVARDLYEETSRLGRRHRLAELVVRGDLGMAVLARIRGNYPLARTRFRRALRRAERAGLGELTGLAHQGLLIADAVAGDFDTALTHAWAAFANAAGDPRMEAYVLVNLATICLDAREDSAALRGYVAAADRTRDVSTWLTATAGVAAAAARLGLRDVVATCAARVERALAREATPYERAMHLLTLSDAFADLGSRDDADAYRARGLDLARAHAFAELELRYARGRPPAPPTAAPATLGPDARRIVWAMRALAEHDVPAADDLSAAGDERGAP
jgi:tetratricopeptide (TPR) repeat protein